jgi:hypothetical protein
MWLDTDVHHATVRDRPESPRPVCRVISCIARAGLGVPPSGPPRRLVPCVTAGVRRAAVRTHQLYWPSRRHSSAVEQLFRKQQVLGSNPSVGSTLPRTNFANSRSSVRIRSPAPPLVPRPNPRCPMRISRPSIATALEALLTERNPPRSRRREDPLTVVDTDACVTASCGCGQVARSDAPTGSVSSLLRDHPRFPQTQWRREACHSSTGFVVSRSRADMPRPTGSLIRSKSHAAKDLGWEWRWASEPAGGFGCRLGRRRFIDRRRGSGRRWRGLDHTLDRAASNAVAAGVTAVQRAT